ncbi:MAG: 16S rRNA (adenine(1518)-N(6)/adenine(1519)-N(6))-dimethyltransferase RsmA [Candidatus Hodarchaeales archaeon]
MNYLHFLAEGNLKDYTKHLVQNYAISPKKSLGQNFVVENDVVDTIVSELALKKEDIIVEVGGGIGSLTYSLLLNSQKVFSYEIDPILSSIMKKEFIEFNAKLKVISGDFLTHDIPVHNKLTSNLPYNISSPFIRKLTELKYRPDLIVLTLQKEFANHLCAGPGNPAYSRISVFSSYFYDFEIVKVFPPHFFNPMPRVHSSLIRGTKREPPKEINSEEFFLFLTNLFCRKHKKVKNNLRIYAKHHSRENRKIFMEEVKKLEFQASQPVKMSQNDILSLFIQFKEILRSFQ